MKPFIKIKNRYIGEDYPTYIIAEMSANHAGDINRAIEIIHAAKEAGADCIKTQTYTPDTLTIDCDNKYFKINGGTWGGTTLYKLYTQAYTPFEWQARLKEVSDKIGIDFLSTPFDATAVDLLESINVDFYKIASFEMVDIPLIRYIASKGKPIIMSTGMGSLGEIEEAVNAIKEQGNEEICLLKCSSSYPAIPADMNLKTIPQIQSLFGVPVGLSDHTMGAVSSITAVALGARVIEKHFCISRDIENPDSSFSMEAKEFKNMVIDIRSTERALGNINFGATKHEEENIVFRKSIFVVKDIKKGEQLTKENIKVIRPGYGLPPKYLEEILGSRATVNLVRGTPLKWTMFD